MCWFQRGYPTRTGGTHPTARHGAGRRSGEGGERVRDIVHTCRETSCAPWSRGWGACRWRGWWSRRSLARAVPRARSPVSTGCLAAGSRSWCSGSWLRARLGSMLDPGVLTAVLSGSLSPSRTRSWPCAKNSTPSAMTAAPRQSRSTSNGAGAGPRRCRRSGGSCPDGGSSLLSPTSVLSPAMCASRPTNPTNAGSSTSPTGPSPMGPR